MKKIFFSLLFLALGAGLSWLVLREEPASVETDVIRRGPLRVELLALGKTRVHDRFLIAAPVAGRLDRIELHEGDLVEAGAELACLAPLPLDPRQQAELEAKLQAARALKSQADEREAKARADHDLARRERQRIEKLFKADKLVSLQQVEQARTAESTSSNELAAAQFQALAATYEVKAVEAGLLAGAGSEPGRLSLRSPIRGPVLRVLEKSERVLPAGTPILELGDLSRREAVLDVLSTDAVRIPPGAPISFTGWGGEQPIAGKVRAVEPAAFTKVSALGVEEQRVAVVAELAEAPPQLGDGYRIEASIEIWAGENVLKAPISSLFRQGSAWSVFCVEQGRLRRHELRLGHRNESEAEILDGLQEGATVVLFPANELREGMPATPRN